MKIHAYVMYVAVMTSAVAYAGVFNDAYRQGPKGEVLEPAMTSNQEKQARRVQEERAAKKAAKMKAAEQKAYNNKLAHKSLPATNSTAIADLSSTNSVTYVKFWDDLDEMNAEQQSYLLTKMENRLRANPGDEYASLIRSIIIKHVKDSLDTAK